MPAGFFTEKKAAAIFKHAVLDQYVDPFAMKTGRGSPGGRVAFVDGYAGEGRYDDGLEGSPALLIAKAKKLAASRRLELHLVEAEAATYNKLSTVVAADGAGVAVEMYRGDVAEHLEAPNAGMIVEQIELRVRSLVARNCSAPTSNAPSVERRRNRRTSAALPSGSATQASTSRIPT